VNNFAVLQYQSGKLEIIELTNDSDPVELARSRNAFLLGITASRSRAEFIVNREHGKTVAAV
jgi:hypothetical protein